MFSKGHSAHLSVSFLDVMPAPGEMWVDGWVDGWMDE